MKKTNCFKCDQPGYKKDCPGLKQIMLFALKGSRAGPSVEEKGKNVALECMISIFDF